MRQKIKNQLSKVKFALGLNPKIEQTKNVRNFIPPHVNCVVTLTADFELAWAPRYDNSVDNAYEHAVKLAKQERSNIPKILELCEKYNIPITWATVGHLFLHSCELDGSHKHPEIPPIPAYAGPYWDFNGGDWFEYDPCSCLEVAPEWYAPDLIKLIMSSKVGHEIGCHTFSHIDCRDEVCPPEVFSSELNMCKDLAKGFGLELKSFVHPGHTVGNLETLANLGFSSFQSDPGNILGYPVRHANGLWELKRTMDCYIRSGWTMEYHIERYKTIIDRAIKSNTVCNLWFHPSLNPLFVDEIFPAIFDHISENRDKIWVCTVNDYINFLNASN